jgi:hypothetical protein
MFWRENIPSIFRVKDLSLAPACTLFDMEDGAVSKLHSITTQNVVVFILITLNHRFFPPLSP